MTDAQANRRIKAFLAIWVVLGTIKLLCCILGVEL